MKVFKYDEYFKFLNEQQSNSDIIEIDLNDPKSKIEIDKRYSFLGVEFTPRYTSYGINDEPYSTIIRKPGIYDGREKYWGKVIRSKDLIGLRNEIRVEIKFYLDDGDMKTIIK